MDPFLVVQLIRTSAAEMAQVAPPLTSAAVLRTWIVRICTATRRATKAERWSMGFAPSFVRFAWGVAMSDRLDHHPVALPDEDRAGETRFDPDRAFLRVERQTLTGFPPAHGALFTIRPYVYPLRGAVATPEQARPLAAALRSMTPEQVAYKGLTPLLPDLLGWLDEQGTLKEPGGQAALHSGT